MLMIYLQNSVTRLLWVSVSEIVTVSLSEIESLSSCKFLEFLKTFLLRSNHLNSWTGTALDYHPQTSPPLFVH